MSNWLDNIEDRAVAAYRAHGWKPTACAFVGEERCALGAVYELAPGPGDYIRQIVEKSGADHQEVWEFIYRFDYEVRRYQDDPASRRLGSGEAELAAQRVVDRLVAEGML